MILQRLAAAIVFVLTSGCTLTRSQEQEDIGLMVRALCEGCDKCELSLDGAGKSAKEHQGADTSEAITKGN